jgi:DNA-binding CsgD family transcriptional regulator
VSVFAYGRNPRRPARKPAPVSTKVQRIRQVERLLAEGMALTDIAAALGMDYEALRSLMRRYGLKKPR